VSVWLTLRRQLVFFLLGALLGALIVSAAKPDKSAELQLLELDVARNGEKIAELKMECQAVKDWIAATDRQKVQDAEMEGRAHAKIDASERVNWLVAAAVLGLLGELVLRKARKT
jgi:hypothetical protein